MTKIAIPSDNGLVSEHFGYCSQFIIFEIDQNKILKKTIVDNPGHKPGSLPPFLHEKGVNQVLAGGMGSRAIDLFQQVGIDVTTGVRMIKMLVILSRVKIMYMMIHVNMKIK